MSEKIKIFIVDDDKFLLSMYSMKFEKNDFEVKIAANGPDALELLRSGYRPNILLIDLVMPIMDGFSTYESMRREKLLPDTIAIMLTNQGLTSDINRARDLGFHGYIIKATTIPSEVVTEVIKIYNKK